MMHPFQSFTFCFTIKAVDEAPRQTIKRRPDEPKLEIGQTVPMGEGIVGVVLARYTRAGKNEVYYVVESRNVKTAREVPT